MAYQSIQAEGTRMPIQSYTRNVPLPPLTASDGSRNGRDGRATTKVKLVKLIAHKGAEIAPELAMQGSPCIPVVVPDSLGGDAFRESKGSRKNARVMRIADVGKHIPQATDGTVIGYAAYITFHSSKETRAAGVPMMIGNCNAAFCEPIAQCCPSARRENPARARKRIRQLTQLRPAPEHQVHSPGDSPPVEQMRKVSVEMGQRKRR